MLEISTSVGCVGAYGTNYSASTFMWVHFFRLFSIYGRINPPIYCACGVEFVGMVILSIDHTSAALAKPQWKVFTMTSLGPDHLGSVFNAFLKKFNICL